ncbi:MAG TPA: exodeoxyribonuclease VII large subunit [Thermoanaerobaculia bacterium]|nr:exodeoxyribonuclease VII large subunit [Thermoanaerobaculia bacterium]
MTDRRVLGVTELLAAVNGELSSRFREIWVEGEVTNLTRSGAGHLYFSIKDAKAQLQIVMFGMWARNLAFRIEHGMKLILRGRLNIYEPRGTFQLMADAAEPAGVGALQLAFEQLKARLAAEGLFEAGRKKPIPMLPQRIAIVTSPTGAAIRDILNVLGRRFEGLSIQVYPVRVQGSSAAREIAAAIRNLSRWRAHDVVLICRGGGSLEDLWPFNEEVVARAIAECAIPTISGVGHEVDFTISDFVADLRAPTPSAAAEIVVQAKAEICSRIDGAVRRVRHVVETRVRHYRSELRHLASSDGIGLFPGRVAMLRDELQHDRVSLFRLLDGQAKTIRRRLEACRAPLVLYPTRLAIPDRRRYLELVHQRLSGAVRASLARARVDLQSRATTLQAVSPLSVLSRGYAIAFSLGRRRKPILDATTVAIGDPIEVQVKKGRLRCTVDGRTLGVESLWPEPLPESDSDS